MSFNKETLCQLYDLLVDGTFKNVTRKYRNANFNGYRDENFIHLVIELLPTESIDRQELLDEMNRRDL